MRNYNEKNSEYFLFTQNWGIKAKPRMLINWIYWRKEKAPKNQEQTVYQIILISEQLWKRIEDNLCLANFQIIQLAL
jgi:hypothetical protein